MARSLAAMGVAIALFALASPSATASNWAKPHALAASPVFDSSKFDPNAKLSRCGAAGGYWNWYYCNDPHAGGGRGCIVFSNGTCGEYGVDVYWNNPGGAVRAPEAGTVTAVTCKNYSCWNPGNVTLVAAPGDPYPGVIRIGHVQPSFTGTIHVAAGAVIAVEGTPNIRPAPWNPHVEFMYSPSGAVTQAAFTNGSTNAHAPGCSAPANPCGVSPSNANSAWSVLTALESGAGAWRVVGMPSPGKGADPQLIAVSAGDSASAWALGYDVNTSATYLWRAAPASAGWVSVAAPPYTTGTYFADVASWGDTAWFVGRANPGPGTVVREWTGTGWIQRSPSVSLTGSFEPSAITLTAANSVWVVGGQGGQPAMYHWNGTRWSSVAVKGFIGVGSSAFTSATTIPGTRFVIAAGIRNAQACAGGASFAELWNGTGWTGMTVPSQASNVYECNYESGPALSPSWFTVNVSPPTGVVHAVVMHRVGLSWRTVPFPVPASTSGWSVASVDESSASSAWVVGRNFVGSVSTGANHVLIGHWNGTNWSLMVAPAPGPDARLFGVVTVPGTCQVDAVGNWWNSVSSSTANPTSERLC